MARPVCISTSLAPRRSGPTVGGAAVIVSVIDREKRERLGDALNQLVEGAITNYQFADLSQSWECGDRAVQTIGEFFVELCTDEREYRLTGTDRLDTGSRAIADRCRQFLQTEQEYKWPEAPTTARQAATGGAAIFLVLPLGVVLLIAALVFCEMALLLAGIACLGFSGLWFWWRSRRENMPEWRAYWASGEREAWPFLHRADWEHALRGIAQPDSPANGSQPFCSEPNRTSSAADSRR